MASYASNPGKIKVEFLRLMIRKPKWPLIFGLPTILCAYLAYRTGAWLWIIPSTLFAGMLWLFWKRQLIHFTLGDVNISKILSTNPPLLATSTNMLTGMDHRRYPVIKIVRGRVPAVPGKKWKTGDYFTAACMYGGPRGKAHWELLDPWPQSCATGNYEDLKASEDALAYLQEEFELRISLVPTPDEPGLYFLDEDRLEALKMWGQAGPSEEIASAT